MLKLRYLIYYNQVLAERHLTFNGARKARLRLVELKGWDINKISIAEALE